jgi:hypothetical protein
MEGCVFAVSVYSVVYCSRVKSDVLQLWQRRDTRLAGRGIEVVKEVRDRQTKTKAKRVAPGLVLGLVERFGYEPNGGVDNKH